MSGNRCLVLRADAGKDIGIGHVKRLLALGQAWREAGGLVIFAAAEIPNSLAKEFQAEGFEFQWLSGLAGSVDDARALASLAQTREAVVALDGYHFGPSYHAVLAEKGIRFLLIDDMGFEGPTPAVYVLNQNFAACASKYPSMSPERLLLGPKYALLRTEFRASSTERLHPASAEKLLITFGGSDPMNAAAKAMEAVASCPVRECLVIAGPANPHIPSLREKAGQLSASCRFQIVEQASEMSEAMRQADAAVAAAGSCALEMAAMGLPAIFLATADNQEMVGAGVSREGLGLYAGRIPEAWTTLPELLAQLVADVQLRGRLSQRGRELVDGRGAERVAKLLMQVAIL